MFYHLWSIPLKNKTNNKDHDQTLDNFSVGIGNGHSWSIITAYLALYLKWMYINYVEWFRTIFESPLAKSLSLMRWHNAMAKANPLPTSLHCVIYEWSLRFGNCYCIWDSQIFAFVSTTYFFVQVAKNFFNRSVYLLQQQKNFFLCLDHFPQQKKETQWYLSDYF